MKTTTLAEKIRIKVALVRIADGYLDFVRGVTIEAIPARNGKPRLYAFDGHELPLVLAAATLARIPERNFNAIRQAEDLDAWENRIRIA